MSHYDYYNTLIIINNNSNNNIIIYFIIIITITILLILLLLLVIFFNTAFTGMTEASSHFLRPQMTSSFSRVSTLNKLFPFSDSS